MTKLTKDKPKADDSLEAWRKKTDMEQNGFHWTEACLLVKSTLVAVGDRQMGI